MAEIGQQAVRTGKPPRDGREKIKNRPVGESTERRLLSTLEQILEFDTVEMNTTLDRASDLLANALGSDKVDSFLYDAAKNTLVAAGTSLTPMGVLQRKLGLDRLPIANGGPEASVFLSGQPYITGAAEKDPTVVPGIINELGVHSMIIVPLQVAGERRGVVAACSAKPNAFSRDDLDFLVAVARWLGQLAHQAELVEGAAQSATVVARQRVADELVTVLAHDLRNYLAPLKGRMDIVRLRARREGRERDLVDLDAALRALNRLQALIQDLLDTGRLDQGLFTLTVEPVDLVALVRETVSMLQSGNTHIELRAPEELVAEVDPRRMRQAIENLVTNSIKHSPKGTAVTVEIASEQEQEPDSGSATISIHDEGPGIDRELIPKVFDRFVRGPGSKGLGLGLYLARSIAEAHKGTVTVESAPGRGTTFILCFPLFGHS